MLRGVPFRTLARVLRRTEKAKFWGPRAVVLAAASAVALAVPVVPVLQTTLGSEGWARVVEAFVLVFSFRVTLVLLAVHEGSFGFLGISLATHGASARAVEDRLLVRIGRISDETDAAADRIGRLEGRVNIIEEALFRGG